MNNGAVVAVLLTVWIGSTVLSVLVNVGTGREVWALIAGIFYGPLGFLAALVMAAMPLDKKHQEKLDEQNRKFIEEARKEQARIDENTRLWREKKEAEREAEEKVNAVRCKQLKKLRDERKAKGLDPYTGLDKTVEVAVALSAAFVLMAIVVIANVL